MFSEMSLDDKDPKGNSIIPCIFESYLAKCALENQDLFKDSCLKMLDALELFFNSDAKNNPTLMALIQSKSKKYDLKRELYMVLSALSEQHPQYDSFQSIKANFNLTACCYLVKLLADNILKPAALVVLTNTFFPGAAQARSPYSPLRAAELFSPTQRGVVELDCDPVPSHSIGIVDDAYQPDDLKNYFLKPICPARFLYKPNEESYVAKWLRAKHLPVISGASGSTELLFSRLFPLLQLEKDDLKIIFFAQALDMVAQGHHSLFEAVIVAEYFHLDACLMGEVDLLSFYRYWIPQSIEKSPPFQAFFDKNPICEKIVNYRVNSEIGKKEKSAPISLTESAEDLVRLLVSEKSFRGMSA